MTIEIDRSEEEYFAYDKIGIIVNDGSGFTINLNGKLYLGEDTETGEIEIFLDFVGGEERAKVFAGALVHVLAEREKAQNQNKWDKAKKNKK